MALPSVVLFKPYLLVTKSGGSITPKVGNFVFGIVQLAYSTSEKFFVNDIILFDPTACQVLTDGTTDYYLVDDGLAALKDIGGGAP